MKGSILESSLHNGTGLIAGDDGRRYTYVTADWRGTYPEQAGQRVDFEVFEEAARAIYLDRSAGNPNKKVIAGILALLLGGLGIHKFYLGYTKEGLIMLLVFVFGFLLFSLPTLVIGVIAFVEGIIYLTRSDADFERIYVQGRKPWF